MRHYSLASARISISRIIITIYSCLLSSLDFIVLIESSTNGKNYLFQVDIAQKSPLKPINRAFLSFSHFSPDPDLLHKSRGVFPLGKYSKMPDLLSISRLFFSLREPVSCLDFLPILVFSYTVTIKKT